uniref:Uncharacterized protein n=1 Tax=Arundo donax TaxID=35708 RepID=A0A0A9HQ53_ARUDO
MLPNGTYLFSRKQCPYFFLLEKCYLFICRSQVFLPKPIQFQT